MACVAVRTADQLLAYWMHAFLLVRSSAAGVANENYNGELRPVTANSRSIH